MKTINLNKNIKFQNIMKKIDISSEESYEKSLEMNLDELVTICKKNNCLERIGGAGGFEKEKYISLSNVKKIKNPKKIEYEDVDKIKEKLYRRADKRLDKTNNESIINSNELANHIASITMEEYINKDEIAKINTKRRKPFDHLGNKTKRIKRANATIITDEMVGHPIGEIFGNTMVGIFQKNK